MPPIRYKQYIIINKSLGMSTGKCCAMTAHASFLALRKQSEMDIKVTEFEDIHHGDEVIDKWINNGECVIVLEVENSSQMFGIQQYLERKEIFTHLYIDEGITEVKMGEPTVLATGVVTEDQFWMFETLDLYSDESDNNVDNKNVGNFLNIPYGNIAARGNNLKEVSIVNHCEWGKRPKVINKVPVCERCGGSGSSNSYALPCASCGSINIPGCLDAIFE